MGRRKVEREMIEVFKVETPVKGALFINRRTDRSLFIFGNYERKKKKILEATGYNIYKTDKGFDDVCDDLTKYYLIRIKYGKHDVVCIDDEYNDIIFIENFQFNCRYNTPYRNLDDLVFDLKNDGLYDVATKKIKQLRAEERRLKKLRKEQGLPPEDEEDDD